MKKSSVLAYLYAQNENVKSDNNKKQERIAFLKQKIKESENAEDALTLAAHFALGFDSENETKEIRFESLDFVVREDLPQSDEGYLEMLKMASDMGHKAGSLTLAKIYAGKDDDNSYQLKVEPDKELSDYYLEIAVQQGSATAKNLQEQGGLMPNNDSTLKA